jgi:hypothetical protein
MRDCHLVHGECRRFPGHFALPLQMKVEAVVQRVELVLLLKSDFRLQAQLEVRESGAVGSAHSVRAWPSGDFLDEYLLHKFDQ